MSLPTRPIIPFHATLTQGSSVLAAPAFARDFNGDGLDDSAIGVPEGIDQNDWCAFALAR